MRQRSATMIWGMPLFDIAAGPDAARNETYGHAKGFIAIGDVATGVIAIGGFARGIFAMGGAAMGVFALGGGAIGLLMACGGVGIGAIAVGGGAVGLIALGGGAIGLIAVGGGAIGYYAAGGGALGVHVMGAIRRDPEAVRLFDPFLKNYVLPNIQPGPPMPPSIFVMGSNLIGIAVGGAVAFWSVLFGVIQAFPSTRQWTKFVALAAIIVGTLAAASGIIAWSLNENFNIYLALWVVAFVSLINGVTNFYRPAMASTECIEETSPASKSN